MALECSSFDPYLCLRYSEFFREALTYPTSLMQGSSGSDKVAHQCSGEQNCRRNETYGQDYTTHWCHYCTQYVRVSVPGAVRPIHKHVLYTRHFHLFIPYFLEPPRIRVLYNSEQEFYIGVS